MRTQNSTAVKEDYHDPIRHNWRSASPRTIDKGGGVLKFPLVMMEEDVGQTDRKKDAGEHPEVSSNFWFCGSLF